MPLLDNPKHERFAQLIALLKTAGEAYAECYPESSPASCETLGPKLFRKVQISARVKELQQASATQTTLTMQERREFLANAVRTPIGDIDEKSPLAQAVEYEIIGTEKTGFRTLMKVKSVGKRECIELDARLAGEFETKIKHSGDIGHTVTVTEEERAKIMDRRRAIREKIFSAPPASIPRDAAAGTS